MHGDKDIFLFILSAKYWVSMLVLKKKKNNLVSCACPFLNDFLWLRQGLRLIKDEDLMKVYEEIEQRIL